MQRAAQTEPALQVIPAKQRPQTRTERRSFFAFLRRKDKKEVAAKHVAPVASVACCHKRHGKAGGPMWFASTDARNAHKVEAHGA